MRLQGSMTLEQRDRMIDAFTNDPQVRLGGGALLVMNDAFTGARGREGCLHRLLC